jgi:hypothetical protein
MPDTALPNCSQDLETMLRTAIANYVGEHSRHFSVRYVTSETFMNDFINSLRDKRIEGFKQRYRTYDLLLIDDIQFLEHKERIQEEFFHTFNSLYEAGRQIVISSDRPPKEIATLEERLRSRFEASRWRSSAISFERRLCCDVRRAPSVRKRPWPARGVSSPRPRSRSSRATWAGLRRRSTRRGRRSKRTATG